MSQAPNQALHLTAFSLRLKASGELGRSAGRQNYLFLILNLKRERTLGE